MSRFRASLMALVAAGAVAVATCAGAAPARRGPRVAAGPDAQFLQQAAELGTAEIAMGRLGRQRALRAEVAQFGDMMVHDHSQGNQELMQLARSERIPVVRRIPPEEAAMQARLARLSGPRFDQLYMEHMVNGHFKAVRLFQREARNGRDPEVRAWAERQLPVLQEHLNIALGLAQNVRADAQPGGMPGGH